MAQRLPTDMTVERLVKVTAGGATLDGNLAIPENPKGLVLFAHGSGSSRHSPRNRQVAKQFYDGGLATLLMDLLTAEEERIDQRTRALRFDIGLLSERLVGATDWLQAQTATAELTLGYFGASTGAAAALRAAAKRPDVAGAVVSRGGRPDLAGEALSQVRAPTLFIVGGHDVDVLALNRQALARLAAAEKALEIIPGATHLFEQPGALDAVAELAQRWFTRYLTTP